MDIEEIKNALIQLKESGNWVPMQDLQIYQDAPEIAQKCIEYDYVLSKPIAMAHNYVEKYKPDHITAGDSVLQGVIKDAEIMREANKELIKKAIEDKDVFFKNLYHAAMDQNELQKTNTTLIDGIRKIAEECAECFDSDTAYIWDKLEQLLEKVGAL